MDEDESKRGDDRKEHGRKGAKDVMVVPPHLVPGKDAHRDHLHAYSSPEHWMLFFGIFLFSSVGGLASLLREGETLTARQVLSAALNSGLAGMACALILWKRFHGEDLHLLLGISVLAGFGGTTLLDFLVQIAKERVRVATKFLASVISGEIKNDQH